MKKSLSATNSRKSKNIYCLLKLSTVFTMLKSTGLQNSHKQMLNWDLLVKLREGGGKTKTTAQNPLLKLEYAQIVPGVGVQ